MAELNHSNNGDGNHDNKEFPSNNVRLMRIPVSLIDVSSLQLRHDLEEQEVEGDLLASIDRFGVKDPPRVFFKEDGRAELIDGHRRLNALLKLLKRYAAAMDDVARSKAAQFQEVVCLVEEIPPSVKKHLELQVLLNAVRKNFSPPVSSDNYFFRSATIRIPDRPCTEQGANDNYFSRSGRQSGLPSGTVSGYALLAG